MENNMPIHPDDEDYRYRVEKALENIENVVPDELGERLGYLTEDAISAEKIPHDPARAETRRLIAQGIRTVRRLLKEKPEIIREETLKSMGARRVDGIDGYTTLYADVSVVTDKIFECAQKEGVDMSNLFVIKEYWNDKESCLKTLKRYMWDSEKNEKIDVTDDESARELFMAKMNPPAE